MEYNHSLELEAFDYHIEGGVERFCVRVADSPAGQQRLDLRDEVTIPPGFREQLQLLRDRDLSLSGMIALGEVLGDLLFPSGARWYLDRSRERLEKNEGLRVQLRLETYALADLPWEYAYITSPDLPPSQKKGAEGFLALDRCISLVRFEVMGASMVSLDPVDAGPLRMVALMADPYRDLGLGTERQNIEKALADVPGIRPEFYPDCTLEDLEDALAREAHVFHFAGHGEFEGRMGAEVGSREGMGLIVLMDEERRKGVRFPAEKLAQNLRGRGVRLAVLGACEVGERDRVNAWTGVVPALTRAGIPAVVGMQYAIYDENAVAFSRRFYRALAEGQPIDAAVHDGRLAIFNRGDEGERDWGVPVLYLRAHGGVLFPRVQSPVRHTPVVKPTEFERPLDEFVVPTAPLTEGVNKLALRTAIVQGFSLDELEVLCADVEQALQDAGLQEDGRPVQLNLEMFRSGGLKLKVLDLIRHLERRDWLGYLVEAVRRQRPGII